MRTARSYYRLGLAVALGTVLFLAFGIGALGIIGAGGPPDLLYVGAVAVGVVGAFLARFRSLGMARALGEYLTEPKASVWFETRSLRGPVREAALDRRTSMMYDARHVFINGESYLASGRDARLMRLLADRRSLGRGDLARASDGALSLLKSWCEAGWVHSGTTT